MYVYENENTQWKPFTLNNTAAVTIYFIPLKHALASSLYIIYATS